MKEFPMIPVQKFESRELPFRIRRMNETAIAGDETNTDPHSNDYYELIWTTKGGGKLYVDLCEYSLSNNSIVCLRPNQVHQLNINDDTEGFMCSFTNSFFDLGEHEFDSTSQAIVGRLFHDCRVFRLCSEMEVDTNEIIAKIIKEFDNRFAYRMEMLRRYFKIFLIYLTRNLEEDFQPSEQSREAEIVESFMKLIEKNFKEKKMVADYAMDLSVTPNHLNRIIKKNTGHSAGHHIRQRIVLEAKRMGRYSPAAMKEIAYRLGFNDRAHFSRFFKTVAGTNFSEFKKEGYSGQLISPKRA